jgi:hypothetical protein
MKIRRKLKLTTVKLEKLIEKLQRREEALKMRRGVLVLQLADLNKVLTAVGPEPTNENKAS